MVVRGSRARLSTAMTSAAAGLVAVAALAAIPLLLLDTQPAVAQQEPRLVIVNVLPPPRPAGIRIVTQIDNPTIPRNAAPNVPGTQPATAQAPAAPAPTAPAASAIAPPPTTLVPQAASAAAPVQVAAVEAGAVVSNTTLSDSEVLARANDYFNTITTMSGRFVQISGNGGRVAGTLYVHRPGRVRFAYDEPSTIDVISDGRSVAVRDRRLATQDLYPVSQTPLKFLIGDRIELGRTIPVLGVERSSTETDVILQDSSTFGGTSRITLTFDAGMRELKKWRILDPQGFETTVSLSELNRQVRVDPSLFVINYQPVWN